MMQLVRTERKKIINAEMKAEAMAATPRCFYHPELTAQQAKANATFVEEEEKDDEDASRGRSSRCYNSS